MQKIIIFILFFAINGQANERKTLNQLEKIQKYVGSMSTEVSDPTCEKCSQTDIFNQCVASICSKGKIKHSYTELRNRNINAVAESMENPEIKAIYGELKDSIKKALFSDLEDYEETFKSTLDVINNEKFSDDEAQIKFLTIFNLMNIGEDDEVKKLPTYLQDQAKKYSAISKEVFANLFKGNSSWMTMDDPATYYKTTYPNLDIKNAIKEDLKNFEILKIKFLASPIVKYSPSVTKRLDDFYKSEFYQNIAKGKDVAISDSSSLLEMTWAMHFMIAVTENPKIKALQDSIDTNEIKKIMHSSELKDKANNLDTKLKDLRTNPSQLDPYINECANNLLTVYFALPTDKVKNSLGQITDDLKKTLSQRVLSKLSEESSNKLKPAVKSWFFSTQSNSEYLHKTTFGLKEKYETNQRMAKEMKELPDSQKIKEGSVDFSFFKYSQDPVENKKFLISEVFSDFERLCDTDLPAPLDDAANTTNGGVHVSWGSLEDINAGKAVMAHELGHLLSEQMQNGDLSEISKGMYNNAMTCLSDKNSSEQYKEEDFADLVSGLVEGSDGNNFACFFNQNNLDPLTQSTDDVHSSSFIRLLQVESTMRGTLPPACTKFLEIASDKLNLENCWTSKHQKSYPRF